jgi:hypothetical protein
MHDLQVLMQIKSMNDDSVGGQCGAAEGVNTWQQYYITFS